MSAESTFGKPQPPTPAAVAAALAHAGLPHGPLDVLRAMALLEEQDVIPRIQHRQEVRARRIAGREVFDSGRAIQRPSDRDFLREAEPPRPRRKK